MRYQLLNNNTKTLTFFYSCIEDQSETRKIMGTSPAALKTSARGFGRMAQQRVEAWFGESAERQQQQKIIEQTILLRRNTKMKTPDAIIAATALVYDLTLITHNTSDFKNIQGLHIIDPYTVV